ncbi:MAG: hypothetical protein J5727_05675 [Kiritimatiellae bacterium]|nr:hypothetical protein [Kiritimatiellia bacterium]
MLALILPFLLSTCDLGTHFANPDAWSQPAVDFAVDHQKDGFGFASQKRDIVNCMKRGACTWHGLEVWETRIYYGADGATRIEMSLYNRGDDKNSGGLDSEGLKKLLDDIAAKAQPGGKIGANPEKKKLKTGGYQFSKKWNKGDCDIDLVWGVNGVKEKDLTADYVRVTMHPKGGAKVKASAKSGGIVSKTKTKANVKKNTDGDVWIDNVPMVDQGQKGYCAAATSERVLRYYGFAIDEHEIAQAAGTTARGGTSIAEMKDAVKAVGSKCRLGYQEIVTMTGSFQDIEKDIELYNKTAKTEGESELSLNSFKRGNTVNVGEIIAAMKPKVVKKMRMKDFRYKKFMSGVKAQVDQGIPVFWGVTLGMFPERGLPQVAGGHIRLIIGYVEGKDPKTKKTEIKEILYTDSWGAGHELKRMPADWAFAITHDAFYLKPL